MTDHHTPVAIDPKELDRAEKMWRNFTTLGKYAIYGIAGLLIVLMLAFVKLS